MLERLEEVQTVQSVQAVQIVQPRNTQTDKEKNSDDLFQASSPPNVFIGGPVAVSSGFPIEAFGNDRLLEVWK
jgi:hypothetical protein